MTDESEYMKEARRLAKEYGSQKWHEGISDGDFDKLGARHYRAEADETLAALLSHIAKGEQARAAGGEFCCEAAWRDAKMLAWKQRDINCGCDHSESCAKCYPPDFRPGGKFSEYRATPTTAGQQAGGAPPAPHPWQGLTKDEIDHAVGELVEYGTDFVAPIYSVVEGVERKLRERNAVAADRGQQAGGGEDSNSCKLTECQGKPRRKPCQVMDASYGVMASDPPGCESCNCAACELRRKHEAADGVAGGCGLPNGVLFDAFGRQRERYVRVTLDGSHLILHPNELAAWKAGEENPDQFTYTDVYLSEEEADALPEFDGF